MVARPAEADPVPAADGDPAEAAAARPGCVALHGYVLSGAGLRVSNTPVSPNPGSGPCDTCVSMSIPPRDTIVSLG